jgi:DNA-binding response OmpR family regulator
MIEPKILLVEDDADVRLGLHVVLKAHRYDTSFAIDVPSAIRAVRTVQPDLIILDLGLPAGDGVLVLEGMRANVDLAAIPVIVVSARDAQRTRRRVLAAGAKAYVEKPWNDAELLALISHHLGAPEVAHASSR